MNLAEIQIRDPFIFPHKETKTYYLFGTTDKNAWGGPGTGFDCYRSNDLRNWEGPLVAFRPPPGFWGTTQFWSPEVHAFDGRHFMLASFKAEGRRRGTQVLVSTTDLPAGPYEPWSDGPVTPPGWECLDGTLHIDSTGNPWIVFCHEWTQIHDGAIHAMPLSPDLKRSAGRPVFLFNASEAPWACPLSPPKPPAPPLRFPAYVTDGPFLHRNPEGVLLMLWSSVGAKGYAMGLARSDSGHVTGPWIQETEPLWSEDGGHGMTFRSFSGDLFLTLHQPNDTPNERTALHRLDETRNPFDLSASRNHQPEPATKNSRA